MMLLTILQVVVVIALSFYYYIVRPLDHWKNKGILQGIPLYSLRRDFLISMGWANIIMKVDRAYKKRPNSRYCGFYLFTTPILLMKDPQLLKLVTIKYFGHFKDRGSFYPKGADSLWSDGLIQLRGENWKRMRPAVSPIFTSSKMKLHFGTMSNCAENLIKFFIEREEDNIGLDIRDVMSRYSNDVTAAITFGITMDSMRNPKNEFYRMACLAGNVNSNEAISFMTACVVLPLPLIKLLGFKLFSKEVVKFFSSVIDERVKSRRESGMVLPDLINTFLEAEKNKRNDHAINTREILPQSFLFFVGGLELTSGVLLYICYELALNEHVQEKLRNEIMETRKKTGGRPSYDSMLEMKYMDMVVSESMRKYPVLPATDRTCTKTCIIEPSDPDEKPLVIEKGTILWIPIYSLHHDPKLFPNPHVFDPERFNIENEHKVDPYTYMPFGIGPRSCIGSRSSILSIKVLMFYLLSNFELCPSENTQVPLQFRKKSLLIAPEKDIYLELRRLKP